MRVVALQTWPEFMRIEMVAAVTASLEMYTRVEELDEPSVPLRHPYRDPGRTPRSGEDPYNAFIRFCEVRGDKDGPLAGKTVGVKDCIAVSCVPTTNGGRRTPAVVPTEDAVVVERTLARALRIGWAFENATEWHNRRPLLK